MHDFDRTVLELEDESDELGAESAQPEYGYEGEFEEPEYGAEYGEDEDESALASELLSVASEEELDHFFGKLLRKAAGAVGKVMKSPLGQTLGGMLKSAAKAALPTIGNLVAPGIGGALATQIGNTFGLETEGLSSEEAEWEAARSFVRFANDAAETAVQAPQSAPPQQVAKNAVIQAARAHAPGLLRGAPQPGVRRGPAPVGGGPAPLRHSGRWIRRGRNIIILGI